MGCGTSAVFGFVTLVSVNPFPGDGREVRRGEPLLSHKKVTDWATQQEVMGYDIDTERMTIALPARNVHDLRTRWAEAPEGRQTATMKAVLVLVGTSHHASFVIRPGHGTLSVGFCSYRICILMGVERAAGGGCLLYTSPSPRDLSTSRMPSSA